MLWMGGAQGAAAELNGLPLPTSLFCSLQWSLHFPASPLHNSELREVAERQKRGCSSGVAVCLRYMGERKPACCGDWWLSSPSPHLDGPLLFWRARICCGREMRRVFSIWSLFPVPYRHRCCLGSRNQKGSWHPGPSVILEGRAPLLLPCGDHICLSHSCIIALLISLVSQCRMVCQPKKGPYELGDWIVCIYLHNLNLGYSCYDNWIVWSCKSGHTNSEQPIGCWICLAIRWWKCVNVSDFIRSFSTIIVVQSISMYLWFSRYIAYNCIQFILSIMHWLQDLWSNLPLWFSLPRQSSRGGTLSWPRSTLLTGCVACTVWFDGVALCDAPALVLAEPQACSRELCTHRTSPAWPLVSPEMPLFRFRCGCCTELLNPPPLCYRTATAAV